MVTRAGKKLLRNTIHTVDHHNKVLEEQDMWRQWELQQGLTMMVSDDAVRSRAKYLRMKMEKCLEKQKPEHSKTIIDLHKKDVESLKKMRNYWLNKLMEAEEKDPDRWGHSGFKELYPEEFKLSESPKHSRSKYNERKKERKKKKHKRKITEKSLFPTDCSENYTSNSTLSENNNIDRPKILKRSKNFMSDSIGERDCKKLKRKHHSLRKSTKRKKNKKYRSASKKMGNLKKYKKARHTSGSSVEEVWVEKTMENRDGETSYKHSSIEALHKISYSNSNSSDSVENVLMNSQCIQNNNLAKS